MPGDPLPVSIGRVDVVDLGELLPMMRAYCDFYEAAPRDDRLVALARALLSDPSGEGVQLIARGEGDGAGVGFATVFWSWSTLDASRTGVMNDLFVRPEARGRGVGRRLIEACRTACRKRGVGKLEWAAAPDNEAAQRLYDSTGAEATRWRTYEVAAW